jgi:hypothetical protein
MPTTSAPVARYLPVVTYAAELLGADLSFVSRIEEKDHRFLGIG